MFNEHLAIVSTCPLDICLKKGRMVTRGYLDKRTRWLVLSGEKVLDELVHVTPAIIGLTSIMYGTDFGLTITDRETCLFSRTAGKHTFKVGDKVLEKYGAYRCMEAEEAIRHEVAAEAGEEDYIVYSQPIKENDLVLIRKP